MTYQFSTEEYLKLSKLSEAMTLALVPLVSRSPGGFMDPVYACFEKGAPLLWTYLCEEVWEDRDRLLRTLEKVAVEHGFSHAALVPTSEAWFDSKFPGADFEKGCWYHIHLI